MLNTQRKKNTTALKGNKEAGRRNCNKTTGEAMYPTDKAKLQIKKTDFGVTN